MFGGRPIRWPLEATSDAPYSTNLYCTRWRKDDPVRSGLLRGVAVVACSHAPRLTQYYFRAWAPRGRVRLGLGATGGRPEGMGAGHSKFGAAAPRPCAARRSACAAQVFGTMSTPRSGRVYSTGAASQAFGGWWVGAASFAYRSLPASRPTSIRRATTGGTTASVVAPILLLLILASAAKAAKGITRLGQQ